jgi:hypothetical protein
MGLLETQNPKGISQPGKERSGKRSDRFSDPRTIFFGRNLRKLLRSFVLQIAAKRQTAPEQISAIA